MATVMKVGDLEERPVAFNREAVTERMATGVADLVVPAPLLQDIIG